MNLTRCMPLPANNATASESAPSSSSTIADRDIESLSFRTIQFANQSNTDLNVSSYHMFNQVQTKHKRTFSQTQAETTSTQLGSDFNVRQTSMQMPISDCLFRQGNNMSYLKNYEETDCDQFLDADSSSSKYEEPLNELFQSVNEENLIIGIGEFVWKIAEYNDSLFASARNVEFGEQKVSKFDYTKMPCVTLVAYVQRMLKYINKWAVLSKNLSNKEHENPDSNCTLGLQALIMALIYFDRLANKMQVIKITTRNVHRLLMISLLVAVKFLEDIPFSQTYWSQVAGLNRTEINSIEVEFCKCLNFDMFVSEEEYFKMASLAVTTHQKRIAQLVNNSSNKSSYSSEQAAKEISVGYVVQQLRLSALRSRTESASSVHSCGSIASISVR